MIARIFLLLALVSMDLTAAGAKRIISTAPSITETLFAMGLGPHVVGVTIFCKFPPEAQKLPKIGTFVKPDMEAILALKPDLVVVQKQPNRAPEQLTRLHIPFIEVDSSNLDDIYAGARAIGKAAGASDGAERMIHNMQSQLQNIGKLTAGRPKLTVAFLVGHENGRLEGMVAGSGQCYFSDLLNYAGGTNIFADAPVPYLKVSLEDIIARDPDVIMELKDHAVSKPQEAMTLWREKRTLKAVRSGHVYALDQDPFIVPGPRAVPAATQLLHLLHPEIKP
jgi:iron complex transport system substrate-binding protein